MGWAGWEVPVNGIGEGRCEDGSETISCCLEAGKSERPIVATMSR